MVLKSFKTGACNVAYGCLPCAIFSLTKFREKYLDYFQSSSISI